MRARRCLRESGCVALLICLSLSCRSHQPLRTPQVSAEKLQLISDIARLASPDFEGRGVGTAGLNRAGEMIRDRFAQLGLVPIEPDHSYRQEFTVPSTQPASTQPVPIANIIGERVGEHADECIIVAAHYDHLGFGGRGSVVPWSHAIHPGADDNASGTAAVLDLARRLSAGPRPGRSILFICFAGEERGLLGSDWFVKHPPIDLSRVVCMINLDMIGRLRDDCVFVGGEGTADAFTDLVRRANDADDLELKTFSRGGGGPSDHLTFSRRRVPVLFLFTGLHGDYHTPRDRPEAVNVDGEVRIVSLVANCIDRLTRISKPVYRDAHDNDATVLTPVSQRLKQSLGIDAAEITGVAGLQVASLAPNSPAIGNVRVGDTLFAVDGRPVSSLSELSDALRLAMPGDELRLTIVRDGQTLVKRVFLAE